VTKVRCPVCARTVRAYQPSGGDGLVLHTFRHKSKKRQCRGGLVTILGTPLAVPDFAEAERRMLAAGAEREPVERMSLGEKYGGKAMSDLWNKARGRIDPPLPPPAPGVEPATAFAERLAWKLVAGVPTPAMVVEILKAVRERDAAIMKAVKS